MATPHAPQGPAGTLDVRARWTLAVLLAVLLLAATLGVLSRGVAAPVGADAPADDFSAARAAGTVATVVAEPRPIGTPANDRAREELATALSALGLEVRTQEAIGVRATSGYAAAGFTRNLVATRPGTDPTGTLVLATHIDSVPGAPGAADAGVGLAVILETVRALGPEALRNDLLVLLVDGEENGLLGAEAYLREEAAQLTAPVVVLNHEARGISGRPTVTRTAGPMHEVLGSMPRPEFESFTDELFALIPNDTDFTEYRGAGWWGMDMAIVDGGWAYHTPQDDAAHLDPGTLQHYGDLTLALTRDLADRELSALHERADEDPVQTTAPWGILQVPPVLVTALGVVALLAALALLVVRRSRRELSVAGTVLGAVGALVALGGGVAAAVLLWRTAAQAEPAAVSRVMGEPFRAELFVAAELVAAGAVALTVWVLLRLRVGRAAVTTGAALLSTGVLAALAVWSPALGGNMVLPATVAVVGALVATALPGPAGLVVRALALLPTGWLVGTQLSALTEFGIASAAGGIAGTTVLALCAAAPLFVGRATDRSPTQGRLRGLLLPVPVALLAVALAVGGLAHSQAAPEPVQERATAEVDGADGATTWEVSTATAWGRGMVGTTGTTDLPGPVAEIASVDDGDRVRIELHSPRGATRLELAMTGGGLRQVTVDGVAWGGDETLTELALAGVRPGQRVVLEAGVEGDPQLVLSDTTFDPAEAAGWTDPPAGISLVQPTVRVSSTLER